MSPREKKARRGATLDELDVRLIELLKKNARATLSELARELGITKQAVGKRLRKLVEAGVIRRFTVEYSLENEVQVIILVKVLPGYIVPEVAERIHSLKAAEEVYEVTGDFDIVVLARLPDISSVNRLVDEIRGVSGVATTNTHIVLRAW